FWAGYNAPCEHGVPNPVDCPDCRLAPEEIEHLVAMHRPYLRLAAADETPDAFSRHRTGSR
ncbi:hypothetical protein, partial [Streptomyces sp. RKAG293]|uniref:hypothetical protein n=1 Tax=Streptomyces sp. RKAG293 TaxID=2893403 RepID=UPI00203421B4